MNITDINIHNFRGIVDARLRLSDYTLLLGPNNAGKSTVIDALRVFYEKDGYKFNPDRDLPYIAGTDEESCIEITYSLASAEAESLKEEYLVDGDKLRLRKVLRSPSEKARQG